MSTTRQDLIDFQPRHDNLVCVDSDGCVFDTMEIKQKQCFHGLIIDAWELQVIEKPLREAAEFVNLYSIHRGRNRFLSLIDVVDLLKHHPDAMDTGVTLPDVSALKQWVREETMLGNSTLKALVDQTGDANLAKVYAWSMAVNGRVAEVVQHIPPFPAAHASLERLRISSDCIVVSQTPYEALEREWDENDITRYVSLIAGQELGTKDEHIELVSKGRYAPRRVLMIGDAPGDRAAANANGAHFYPINPADEEASWQRFRDEAYERFLAGTYNGDYEAGIIAEFTARLPQTPPWA